MRNDNTEIAVMLTIGVVGVVYWWLSQRRGFGSGYTSASLAMPGLDAMYYASDDPRMTNLSNLYRVQPLSGAGYPQTQRGSEPSQTGARVTQAATAGGLGATAAIAAPGAASAAMVAIPIIGAGAGLLTWGILQEGWFRGGEEALHVNPARDQFWGQFGGPGFGDGSGVVNATIQINQWTLDAIVTDDRYIKPVLQADTMDELTAATKRIQYLFAQHGQQIYAF